MTAVFEQTACGPAPRFTRTACGYGSLAFAQARTTAVFAVATLDNQRTLKNISGTIALAGAGKMGGAMLDGLARRRARRQARRGDRAAAVAARSARSPPRAFASIRETPARSARWWWR